MVHAVVRLESELSVEQLGRFLTQNVGYMEGVGVVRFAAAASAGGDLVFAHLVCDRAWPKVNMGLGRVFGPIAIVTPFLTSYLFREGESWVGANAHVHNLIRVDPNKIGPYLRIHSHDETNPLLVDLESAFTRSGLGACVMGLHTESGLEYQHMVLDVPTETFALSLKAKPAHDCWQVEMQTRGYLLSQRSEGGAGEPVEPLQALLVYDETGIVTA